MNLIRGVLSVFVLMLLWQVSVSLFNVPPYILPSPVDVFVIGYLKHSLIFKNFLPTLAETLLGLFFGCLVGVLMALFMSLVKPVRHWVLPILLISQALPTFAIAPLLVIWFGYGVASKVIMTMIMLFFPVTNAFFYGLRKTDLSYLDTAQVMGATHFRTVMHVRVPAALPSLATGIRLATAIAPIGAVVGEWVGSSRGLGFLMLNAHARMQIDLMFACLFVIVLMSLILYFSIDKLLARIITW